jgi:hypothetical protein
MRGQRAHVGGREGLICIHKCSDVARAAAVIALQLVRLTHRALRTLLPLSLCAQAADNEFVCGAYTPISWPADAAKRNASVADPSGRTFLFSLENAHGRAVRLRLKRGDQRYAINLNGAASGPGFGYYADLRLMAGGLADKQCGCCTHPSSFELDGESERATGLPPILFAYDKALLAGDGKGTRWVYFAAAEIEVYQL